MKFFFFFFFFFRIKTETFEVNSYLLTLKVINKIILWVACAFYICAFSYYWIYFDLPMCVYIYIYI